MNLVIVHVKSGRFEDLRAVQTLLPRATLPSLTARFHQHGAELGFDLESPQRDALLRILCGVIEVIRARALETRINHLVEDTEDPEDPLTEIDLELLEIGVEAMLGQPLPVKTGSSQRPDPEQAALPQVEELSS